MTAFASKQDLTAQWRALRGTESKWAEELLDAAARWIRSKRPDIAADDPDAKLVSIAVVRSAIGLGEHQGLSQFSSTLGPRSKSGTLVNPEAALVWLPWMKEQLGIGGIADPQAYFGDGDFRERW